MNDFDGGMRALSDSSHQRRLIALRAEEHIQPFPGDGGDRDQAIPLHHIYLPLLKENTLVAWNRDTSIVRRGNDVETVEPVLTALEGRRDALLNDYRQEEEEIC